MAFEISKLTRLYLGYVGENESRIIDIDVSDWLDQWTDAIIAMTVQRPQEKNTYIPVTEVKGNILSWTVRREDVAIAGNGMAQIRALQANTGRVYMSRVVPTVIAASMSGDIDDGAIPPESGWVNTVLMAASDAQQSEDDAKGHADRAEAAVADLEQTRSDAIAELEQIRDDAVEEVVQTAADETSKATSAIAQKGADTLASIPEDYTALASDVGQLSEEISDVSESVSEIPDELNDVLVKKESDITLSFSETHLYIDETGEHDFSYTYQSFVDVNVGEILTIHGVNYGTVPSCVALNIDGTFHGYIQNSNSYDEYDKVYKVENGVAKVVFQTNSSRVSKYSLSIKASRYELKEKSISETALDDDLHKKIFSNNLTGKSVVFTGDSICNGASAKDGKSGWAGRIGTANNMNWVNRGISGATITKGVTGSSGVISDTDFDIDGDAPDYIIFEGGTNDADLIGDARTTPPEKFGAIAEGVAGYAEYSFDQTTFCGAFEYMLYRIVNTYPKAKVGYIVAQKMTMTYTSTPDYTPQNNNRRLYFEKAIEICRKWGIPVLNLWDECNINPRIPSHYTYGETEQQQIDAKRFYVDGQHLTEYGYDYITPKIEAWMKTL